MFWGAGFFFLFAVDMAGKDWRVCIAIRCVFRVSVKISRRVQRFHLLGFHRDLV